MSETADGSLALAIVENTPDAIICADAEGKIRLWNAGATTLFGFEAHEVIGQTMDLIIPDRLRERHWEGYRRVMATGTSRYGPGEMLAVPAVRKDGSRVSLEFTIALLKDGAGTVTGTAAILRDVSARRQQEKELRERIAALEARG